MYLGTLHISLDLEPEVTTADRERLLRALRDRMRQIFGQRITIRTDDESALMIAFFDDGYARTKSRIDEMAERVESFGEARILSSHSQVFRWYDGRFQETRSEPLSLESDEFVEDGVQNSPSSPPRSAQRTKKGETVQYTEEEGGRAFSPIPSRFGRRNTKHSFRR